MKGFRTIDTDTGKQTPPSDDEQRLKGQTFTHEGERYTVIQDDPLTGALYCEKDNGRGRAFTAEQIDALTEQDDAPEGEPGDQTQSQALIPAVSFVITGSESHQAQEGRMFDTWQEIGRHIRQDIAPDGGYCKKTNFTITFADGEEYAGRLDVLPPTATENDNDIAQHVRRHLEFYAGEWCPDHMTREDYEALLESTPEAVEQARYWLATYAIPESDGLRPEAVACADCGDDFTPTPDDEAHGRTLCHGCTRKAEARARREEEQRQREADPLWQVARTRKATTKKLRQLLKKRSGKGWSVRAGRGTGSAWLRISAPPRRQVGEFGYTSPEECRELADLLGLDRPVSQQGHQVSPDEYFLTLRRARGDFSEGDRDQGGTWHKRFYPKAEHTTTIYNELSDAARPMTIEEIADLFGDSWDAPHPHQLDHILAHMVLEERIERVEGEPQEEGEAQAQPVRWQHPTAGDQDRAQDQEEQEPDDAPEAGGGPLDAETLEKIRQIRQEIVSEGATNSKGGASCGQMSEALAVAFGWSELYSRFTGGGEVHDHAWATRPDGVIIDATIRQFGDLVDGWPGYDDVAVIEPGHPFNKHYYRPDDPRPGNGGGNVNGSGPGGAPGGAPAQPSLFGNVDAPGEEDGTVQPLIDADRPYDLEAHEETMEAMRTGQITADALRQAFDRYRAGRERIEQDLNGYTVKELRKMTGRRYRVKDGYVKAIYLRGAAGYFEPAGGGYMYAHGMDPLDGIADKVATVTDEMIRAHAEAVAEQRAARRARLEAHIETVEQALTNPQTLEQFHIFVNKNGEEALTAEQLARFDALKWEEAKARRAEQAEREAEQARARAERVAGQLDGAGVTMTIHQDYHDKKECDIWIVKLSDRVDRDIFRALRQAAKADDGYYSRYSGGFIFFSPDAAEAFTGGRAEADQTQTPDPEKETGEGDTTAERLADWADRAAGRGEEKLHADRQVNTVRRARIAAGVEADARAEIALAGTVRRIARAMEAGELDALQGVQYVTQIRELVALLNRAHSNAVDAENERYTPPGERRPFRPADIAHARYPWPSLRKRDARALNRAIKGRRGTAEARDLLKGLIGKRGGEHEIIRFDRPALANALITLGDKLKQIDGDPYLIGRIGDTLTTYKRLQAVGLTSPALLRHALRDLAGSLEEAEPADPVVEAERDLIGRKMPGYFPTPADLADRVVRLADIRQGDRVLEPSAGSGALLDALQESQTHGDAVGLGLGLAVDVVELQPRLWEILRLKGWEPVANDIMEHAPGAVYDRAIMNPPFERGQDFEHLRHVYGLLRPGGRVVCIVANGATYRKEENQEWLAGVDLQVDEALPAGTFAESGTNVSARLLVIDKPEAGGRPEPGREQGQEEEKVNAPGGPAGRARAQEQAQTHAAEGDDGNAAEIAEIEAEIAQVDRELRRIEAESEQYSGHALNPAGDIGGIRSRSKRQKDRIFNARTRIAREHVQALDERRRLERKLKAVKVRPARARAEATIEQILRWHLRPGDLVHYGIYRRPLIVKRINEKSVTLHTQGPDPIKELAPWSRIRPVEWDRMYAAWKREADYWDADEMVVIGDYRYKLRATGGSSDRFGVCEACGEHAPDVHHQMIDRRQGVDAPDPIPDKGEVNQFGHADCLRAQAQRPGR